ncbi:spore germination protein [Bacillus subtilis]|uniref:spore germination protein n=1 Tax=Bacillus TaxID=1386 RepID=UPI0002B4017B|nr:spore germination protein [Bacillus subtilis]AGE63617.1 putative spore germination protein [Bacillus subtilis XF-1]ASK23867.1 putative spore germination protein [Bacillus subtilis]MBE1868904.1 spore germination protein [Bacillus subtilis]MCL9628009.1 spore germination protein [Bacillus subtilis]MCM3014186.1 spore germination protein [Bacillus subtilis]
MMRWRSNQYKTQKQHKSDYSTAEKQDQDVLTGNIGYDLEHVKRKIGHNGDVHFRELEITHLHVKAALIFVEGLSDQDLINKGLSVLAMNQPNQVSDEISQSGKGILTSKQIKNQIVSIGDVIESEKISDIVLNVFMGSTALLIDGIPQAFLLGTVKKQNRSIEEPLSEALVRGPRTGFTEELSTNTALLRQQGKNDQLTLQRFEVGTRLKKDLIIAYMNDIADPKVVEEVRKRVRGIEIDHLPESGYVEQLIEDNYLSPFPQVQSTERPDRVISGLMEGRVAILLDGTPFALIVPVTFSMMLQSPEDYYERWFPSSLIRLLRFIAAMITLFAPALYISFISFHPGLIPTKLAISISGTRQGVPFPSLIEALFMEVAIEILREAGLRLPKPIGPAIGIVGGLIIGEAAVQAGIVSPIMVIVVALTAISSFAIPHYSTGIALRMLRFGAMFCAAVFGLFGVIMYYLLLSSHVVKLKSFGVPYASPAVPYHLKDWKDFVIRMPLLVMKRRPKMMNTDNTKRVK